MVSGLVLNLEDYQKTDQVAALIRESASEQYEVMTWEEMLTGMVQQIEADRAGGYMMIGILYLVIGFGILGTIIMMTAERRKEFGVMIAIGMKKARLYTMVVIESLLIALVGVISGLIGGLPILLYYASNPIQLSGEMANTMEEYGFEPVLKFSLDPSLFSGQGLAVFILTLMAIIYPAFVIKKMKAVKALRS